MGIRINRTIMFYDKMSKNDRMYTRESACEAVGDFKKHLEDNYVFGSLSHDPQKELSTNFDMKDASHGILDINDEDDRVTAEIELLDSTNKAEELYGILDDVVFRPRIIGNVVDGVVHVHGILTVDAIPKSKDAWGGEE